VNLAIASFFLLFATSLIAGKSFSLPGWLVERMSAFQLGSGSGGVVLMGMIFTLTAFTCTAPFIGSLLVVASQGNWRWPLAGMLVFSSVLAAPFFVIALVPGVLGRGRRSARWMPVTELALGGVEVGAAVKFVSNADLVLGWGVFTRAAVISLWIAILAGLVVTTLARYRRSGLVHACFVVGLIGYLAPGLFGRRLGEFEAFLPPMSQSATRGEPLWLLNDYDAALRIAVRQRRPVLIDFTGYTCTNCRWMEANMFPREDLRRALDQFVRVRLYTDGIGHPYDAQQRMEQTMFATIALPMYGVVDPAGEPRARFLGMTRSASEFVSFLTRSAR
jgi:thiol:disulfide interchange protein DsbD